MTILWTKNAIEHLASIYEYIAANSPAYAKRTVDKITRRSMQIADMPESAGIRRRRCPRINRISLSDYLQDENRAN
jgi:plasmid stabilization system protein ParE